MGVEIKGRNSPHIAAGSFRIPGVVFAVPDFRERVGIHVPRDASPLEATVALRPPRPSAVLRTVLLRRTTNGSFLPSEDR